MNYKICFICTGNACRSPFAETVMLKLLKDFSIENIEVSSMGTLDWGENPRDTIMVDVAREMGYEMTGTTTPMTRDTLMEAELIIVFESHHRNVVKSFLDYSHWNRIVLFNQIAFGAPNDVMDPNYQTIAVYRNIARLIEEGCRRIMEEWQNNPPISQD